MQDYNQRSVFIEQYERGIRDYNKALNDSMAVLLNNTHYATWLTVTFLAVYTLFGGEQVLQGEATLGMFLTDLSIIAKVGQEWGSIYDIAVEMQTAFPGLKKVVRLLNLPLDVGGRMKLNRIRRAKSGEMTAEIRKRGEPGIPLDKLPIVIDGLRYGFKGDLLLNIPNKVTVQQGQLIAVVGKRGKGKSTLLRILGNAIVPEVSGSNAGFFVPSHLRLLHMSPEPMFFYATMLENLAFGVRHGDSDGDAARVVKILHRLGLPDEIIREVHTTTKNDWGDQMSLTQQHLCSMARAMIANFEVVVTHKPTLAFDEQGSKNILSVLKEFISNRGVEQDPLTIKLRRPRTVVYSSSKVLGVEMADSVFYLSQEGISKIEKGMLTAQMIA
eukprot:gnl/TRDRNA2_/TRDRNA2_172543_c4_seq9.p1 gnl/TRDRNA2_/TRDRNA2_172543_c4~~gnl/TRDRNA2_/TRDRNA2_172543_c4_seq9.p1  ORF type:complete len:385 (+),score=53.94 gnl/TRDRNA2_/TRDRNA2_172543_c4_seq9:2-1156(+)